MVNLQITNSNWKYIIIVNFNLTEIKEKNLNISVILHSEKSFQLISVKVNFNYT